MQHDDDSLGAGLVYATQLPVRWTPLPEDASSEAARRANAELLRILAVIEEPISEPGEERAAAELQVLNAKLDVLIELTGRLLSAQEDVPPEVPVRLRATGMEWFEPQPPAAGQRILLELFLSRHYPTPLRLAARVVTSSPADATSRIVAHFETQDESTRDWLEKRIFRHHRRMIAQRRRTDS